MTIGEDRNKDGLQSWQLSCIWTAPVPIPKKVTQAPQLWKFALRKHAGYVYFDSW